MPDSNPRSTAQIAGHPIHPMLIPFPVAFLISAAVCDSAFWSTKADIWATASMWLLGAGVVMALVAALFGFTDYFGDRRIRAIRDANRHMIGNLLAVILALINWFIRYQSGASDGVLPFGIWISLVTIVLLLECRTIEGDTTAVGEASCPVDLQSSAFPDRPGVPASCDVPRLWRGAQEFYLYRNRGHERQVRPPQRRLLKVAAPPPQVQHEV